MDLPVDDILHRASDDIPRDERSAPREATLLGSFDVFSLIVNKMIGTGIYTAPTTVLILTQDKQLSLGLWAIGFFNTIMSMVIYLDYAAVFPYTGGEIIYMDEITSTNNPSPSPKSSIPMTDMPTTGDHRREGSLAESRSFPTESRDPTSRRGYISRVLLGDGLLAYTVFAFLFVGVFNSGTNILLIGKEVLVAIKPDEVPNNDLIRFLGVFSLMMLCLIQLFSSRAGRVLNRFFAIIKITFLLVLLGFGAAAAYRNRGNMQFTKKGQSTVSSFSYAQALLVVLYSFEGWENATFVAGEISTDRPGTLRKGFIWAVAVVGVLYMLLNTVVLAAINLDYLEQVKQQNYLYASIFSKNSVSARRGWSIILALSSAGNANTVIYTFTRVKQSIGRMNILPWSSLWKKDFSPHQDRHGDRHKTPLGGLLLEFIATVAMFCATAMVPGPVAYINVPGDVRAIAHCFILIVLDFGLLRLKSREKNLEVIVERSRFPRVSHWKLVPQLVFILMYAAMNMFLFVTTSKSTIIGPTVGYSFPGKLYPTIVLSFVGLGIVYYWFVLSADTDEPLWNFSLMRLANAKFTITKQPNFDMENETARRFGHRRSIEITFLNAKPKWKSWIFWFFGGSIHHSPIDAIEDIWLYLYRWTYTKFEAVKSVPKFLGRYLTRSSRGAVVNSSTTI